MINYKLLFSSIILSFLGVIQGYSQEFTCVEKQKQVIPDNAYGLAGLKDTFWKNGQTIYIKFINGSDSQKNTVKNIANTWMKYANVKFSYVNSNHQANVRISFTGKGNWSYLGARQLSSSNTATMNISSVTQRIILHEFGHMLGLIHEHKHPNAGIPWNKPQIYKDYKNWYGWSEATIKNNLFAVYSHDRLQKGVYDKYSIMHYSIPNKHTIGNFEVSYNTKISNLDKEFIGKIYPFQNKPNILPHSIAANWYDLPFSTIDAALNYPGGKCYLFYEDKYVRWDHSNDTYLTPKSTKQYWKGVTFDKIDAAFYWKATNKVYFFSGTQYIRYDVTTQKADVGPRSIKKYWGKGNMFSTVDAVLPYSNGKVYFFKGNEYIRFDFNGNYVDSGYPVRLTSSSWKNVSFTELDAIVPWKYPVLYLFSGSQYHRFDLDKNTAY